MTRLSTFLSLETINDPFLLVVEGALDHERLPRSSLSFTTTSFPLTVKLKLVDVKSSKVTV